MEQNLKGEKSMKSGLTMLELKVETENGEVYHFSIDREKTVVVIPWEEKRCYLISSGPIAVGLKLRGRYKTRINSSAVYKFETTKVTNIVAKFTLNQLIE